MNTKFKSDNIDVNPEFDHLFSFENKDVELQYKADAISLRILSEVEKICGKRNIKKAALASSVGTSKSYITQLFSGAKQVNMMIMAKFEDVLNITFHFRTSSLLDENAEMQNINKDKFFNAKNNNGLTWHKFANVQREDKTSQFIKLISVTHDKKQVS